jgi:hypothetical protein
LIQVAPFTRPEKDLEELMPFCPSCRYEYQAGVTRCADCGGALVEKLPETSRPVHLVELYTGRSIETRMLQETLREHGIPSLVRAAEPMRGIIGDAALPMFEQLLIAAEDLEAQREVIDQCLDFVRQGAELPNNTEEGIDEGDENIS